MRKNKEEEKKPSSSKERHLKNKDINVNDQITFLEKEMLKESKQAQRLLCRLQEKLQVYTPTPAEMTIYDKSEHEKQYLMDTIIRLELI